MLDQPYSWLPPAEAALPIAAAQAAVRCGAGFQPAAARMAAPHRITPRQIRDEALPLK